MSESHSRRRWIILILSSLIVFTGYFALYQISALAYILMPELALTPADLSNLMFTPMITAMVLSIPMGMLADRYGSKAVVGVALVIAALAAFVRVGVAGYEALVVTGMVVGLAPAAINANYMRLFGAWFGHKSGIALCVYYAFSGLGAAIALMSATAFGSVSHAFLVTAVILAVLAVLWIAFAKDAPEGGARVAAIRNARSAGEVLEGFGLAVHSKAMWLVLAITGIGLAAKSAYLGFLPQALAATASASEANMMASAVAWGGIVGNAIGPLVIFNHRRPRLFVCLVNGITGLGCVVTGLMISTPVPLLFFAIGAISSFSAPMIEAIPSVSPELRNCLGSAGGVIGMGSLAISYLLPLVMTLASGANYVLLLAMIGGCYLVTVVLMLFVPHIELASNTKGRPREN